MSEKLVLITGATGHQGGATLRHLAKHEGFRLARAHAQAGSDTAKALMALGAEVVSGDLDDDVSLARALGGAWGVYSVQNTWEAGVEKEEVQGKRLAQLARDKHVQRFVYASVASADKAAGIPTSTTSSASSRRWGSASRRTRLSVPCSSWRTCSRRGRSPVTSWPWASRPARSCR